MANLITKMKYEELSLSYGDVVRLTRAIRKSSGKRYKFVGAVYDPTSDHGEDEPIYLDLIEIGKGTMRSIRPEHVIKDVKASKAEQERIQSKGKK